MKKKYIITLIMAMGIALLTACTSSENIQMQNAGAGSSGTTSGSSGTTQTVTGTPVANTTSSDTGSSNSATSSSSDNTQNTAQPEQTSQDADAEIPVIPDQDAGEDGTTSDVPGEFDGVVQEMDDIWSGTYATAEESVTLTKMDDNTISFAFQQAGISGMAEVEGYSAIYKGDDYYIVEFAINEDILTVTVMSEEDEDASGSALNGTYKKQ